MSKMNVILVLSDQHNAAMMGCAGHSQAKTPNLDSFAASGTIFTNAITQNTICTPSRMSILSGQYCHNHGYYGLSGPKPQGLDNYLRHLKKNGYRTAGIGKLHLPNSPENWLAGDLDFFGDSYETEDGDKRVKSKYEKYLEDLGLLELEDSSHNSSGIYGKRTIPIDSMPSKLPYEHTQEVWCAREAMKFMEESSSMHKPFSIKVSLQRPHHPLLPNKKFWDLYPEDIDLPKTFDQEPSSRPPHFQAMFNQLRELDWDYSKAGESYKDGARRAWRGTLACISQMDDVFGMILDFLEEKGLDKNTIVIYGTDHGCYHGIHGILEKAPGICSDAVTRVPMIWRVPGITKAGTKCDQFVENIDIAPTITSLCGIEPMESVDGKDITTLLKGDNKPLREVAVTENPWSKAIYWKNWRMVHYQPEMFDDKNIGELYNISNDPDEINNLYHDEKHKEIVNEGRKLLLEWLIRTTRVVTNHNAIRSDERFVSTGRYTYPLASDGKAPDPVQPFNRTDNNVNYL